MKKLIIALFAFAAMFAVAGSVSAADYTYMASDVSGNDTYTCFNRAGENNPIDCITNVSGTITFYDNIISQPYTQVRAVHKLSGVNKLAIYYVNKNILGTIPYIRLATLDLDTSIVSYAPTLITDRPAWAVTEYTAPGEVYPRIVYIDCASAGTSGAVRVLTIKNDGTGIQLNYLTGDMLYKDPGVVAWQDPTRAYTYFIGKDSVTGNFELGYDNLTGLPTNVITISTTDMPVKMDIAMQDSTYNLPVIVIQETTNKDLLQFTANSATTYATAATVKSLSDNVGDLEATSISTGPAIAFSNADGASAPQVELIKTNETGAVLADITVDQSSGSTYGLVSVDADSSSRAVVIYEENAGGNDYLRQAVNTSGSNFTFAQLEPQEEEIIPELPGNTIWKVVIAVLSLGLVVGIAAFLKKKKKK